MPKGWELNVNSVGFCVCHSIDMFKNLLEEMCISLIFKLFPQN